MTYHSKQTLQFLLEVPFLVSEIKLINKNTRGNVGRGVVGLRGQEFMG